jgi:hypothetical protein
MCVPPDMVATTVGTLPGEEVIVSRACNSLHASERNTEHGGYERTVISQAANGRLGKAARRGGGVKMTPR